MEAYTAFASVYDMFMADIPYEEWNEYLQDLLKEYKIKEGTVLDLGCGTGTITELLADQGFDMIGLDYSEDMLSIAMDKKEKSGHDILYLMQDMRELELYGSVRAVVSICDSLNYILEEDELEEVFRRVNKYLDPDGVFIFDFKTDYFYREILGNQTIADTQEACSYIWDNYYYEEERINEYELSIFIEDKELSQTHGEVFRRFKETHLQRGYFLDEIKEIVEKSGLRFITAYEAFTKNMPQNNSERIYIIAGKGEN